jgi:2,4-dienoyl-CoA reductase (NADPH2)
MEAVITLHQRGHRVTLFEKDKLGGQFNLAPLPPQKRSLQKQINYLRHELEGIPVIIKEAEPEDLLGKYDGVVFATGSKQVIPPIDGLDNYSCAEILYETNIPRDKNVLIIGGGLVGIEIANTLIDYGNKITIIEMLDDIARDMEMVSRRLNLMRLRKNNVLIFTNTKVDRINGSSVFLKRQNVFDNFRIDNIDIYVVAAGMRPNQELIDKLKGKIPYYVVGDADKIGDAASAIQSAYFTCKEL